MQLILYVILYVSELGFIINKKARNSLMKGPEYVLNLTDNLLITPVRTFTEIEEEYNRIYHPNEEHLTKVYGKIEKLFSKKNAPEYLIDVNKFYDPYSLIPRTALTPAGS